MKKKTILYLLTIILTLFINNLNVNAAQELTCVYNKDDTSKQGKHDKVGLIQYSNGDKIIIKNYNDVGLDADGWYGWPQDENHFADDMNLTNDILATCPSYVSTIEGGEVFFSNVNTKNIDFNGKSRNLEWFSVQEKINEIKEPQLAVITTPTSSSGWMTDLDTTRYTGSCLYSYEIPNTQDIHYIQLDIGEKFVQATEYDSIKEKYIKNSSGVYEIYRAEIDGLLTTTYDFKFKIAKDIIPKNIVEDYGGNCPRIIMVTRDTKPPVNINLDESSIMTEITIKINTTVALSGNVDKNYNQRAYAIDVRGTNPITKEKLTLQGATNVTTTPWGQIKNCEDLFGEDSGIPEMLNTAWNIIKIGVPIILLILGTLDFGQAVFAGKEDDMKKAQSKFIKRIIIAIVIFLIPTILELLLSIANSIWPDIIGEDICGILM